jgi:ketosteroid isomerase-like protein
VQKLSVRTTPTGRTVSRVLAVAAFAVMSAPIPAHAQPGMGGNVGKLRGEAAFYRAHVRNQLTSLLSNLSGLWDDSNPGLATALYMPNATIVLGADEIIEGRDKIRAAFAGKLGKMRGVHITMDEFDLSDELAYVRGTMSYELIRPGAEAARESAAFAMMLRVRRDEWLIQSHVLAGKPVLPEEPAR